MQLRPASADIPDFTLKSLASCSKYVHNGGLTDFVALSLSLIGWVVELDGRIHDQGLRAHNDIFSVFGIDYDRS